MTFTLHGMLDDLLDAHGDRAAVSLDDTTLTFAELAGRSERIARALSARGIRTGDRVAVLARNRPDYYALTFACSRIGAVMVGLNWRLAPRELAVIVEDARPRLLVADADLVGGVAEAARAHGAEVLDMESGVPRLVGEDGPPLGEATVATNDAVVQMYSSGTTGRPKGIVLTHENLSPTPISARRLYGMSHTSVNLLISPLFHIGGLGYSLTCMSLGGHTVLVSEASAGHLLRQIERWRVTHSFQVPSVVQALVDADGPEDADRDLGSLEVIAYGGAPMSPALLCRARERLGCRFLAVYGLTETAGTVIALPPEVDDDVDLSDERLLKSIGRPLPWMGETMVADMVTGKPCPPHVVGEIRVRSLQVMAGYWNRPKATSKAVDADGWLRTGDAAYVDERGFFYLHDRIKDMIISGGENVFPAEVEAVLAELPEIGACAVIGVPSERWGETVKAVVVARAGQVVDPQRVISYCRDNLAHYKCPTSVDVVDQLPYNASGKLLKHQLRAAYTADLASV